MDNVRKNNPRTSLIAYLFSNLFALIQSSKSNFLRKSPPEPDFFQEKNKLNDIGTNDLSLEMNKFGILTGPDSIIDCSVSMGYLNKLVGGRLIKTWFEKEDTDKEISSIFLIENCEFDNAALPKCDIDDNSQNEFTASYKLKKIPPLTSKSWDENNTGPSGEFYVQEPPLGECSSKHNEKNNRLCCPSKAEHVLLPKIPVDVSKKNYIPRDPNGDNRKFPKFPPNLWSRNEVLDHLDEHEEDSFPNEEDDKYPMGIEEEMIFHIDDVVCSKEGPAEKSDKFKLANLQIMNQDQLY